MQCISVYDGIYERDYTYSETTVCNSFITQFYYQSFPQTTVSMSYDKVKKTHFIKSYNHHYHPKTAKVESGFMIFMLQFDLYYDII